MVQTSHLQHCRSEILSPSKKVLKSFGSLHIIYGFCIPSSDPISQVLDPKSKDCGHVAAHADYWFAIDCKKSPHTGASVIQSRS